jgi:hypothetical protein
LFVLAVYFLIMKNLILCLFLLINQTIIFAQKHDNLWKLGESGDLFGFELNFLEGNPKVINQSCDLEMGSSGFTMSNSIGNNVLFYTDGDVILGADDVAIEGGEDITDGKYSGLEFRTSAIPKPNTNNSYLLFFFVRNISTLQFEELRMIEINMDLNNGLGAVVSKTAIETYNHPTQVQFTMTKHANGRDWWFITNERLYHQLPLYKTYLIQPDTIIGPRVQILGDTAGHCICYNFSQIGFSLDGSIMYDKPAGPLINFYHFDRCTGDLSFWKSLTQDINVEITGGCAISKENKYFYSANGRNYIHQYELQMADMESSKVTVLDEFKSRGSAVLQFGADGRIYAPANGEQFGNPNNPTVKFYIEGINFPSRKGIDCTAKLRLIKIGSRESGYLPYYPNYRLGPIDGSTCDSLGLNNHPLSNWRWDIEDSTNIRQVTFTDNASYEPTTWHWDFGDGTMSQDTSPVHTYAQNGVYYVCLTVCNANSCDTLCRDVYIGVSGVEETGIAQPKELIVYPNPAADILYLKLQSNQQCQVQISDLTGKIVLQKEINQQSGTTLQEINIAHLPIGMYVLTVRDVHGLVGVTKVVVSRE